MKITNIIFDLDNTLIDEKSWAQDALEDVAEYFKNSYAKIIPEETIDCIFTNQNFLKARNKIFRQYKGKLPKNKFRYLYFKNALKQYITQKDIISDLAARYSRVKDASPPLINNAFETVKKLHKEYTLSILTNSHSNISGLPFSKYFKKIIRAEDTSDKIRKPSGKIFNLLLKKLNIKPFNAIMIGDSLTEDIYGAHQAGIKTIWYQQEQKNIKVDKIKPDYIIEELQEIPNILKDINSLS